MNGFASQIISGTPVWVWGILATLVVLGLQQLRARTVRRHIVLIAPVAFLFVGLLSAGRGASGFAVWALALLTTAALTFLVWKPTAGARYDAAIDRLHVPGSAVPMLLMLTIFLFNYAINVVLAVNPALRGEFAWQVGPALILGALSGIFIGRAATLFRMNRSANGLVAA